MESLTLTLSMSIVHGLPETDSLWLNYWYLMVSLLTDFYALSLLHFPLPHFQRPRHDTLLKVIGKVFSA